MVTIHTVADAAQKSRICEQILRALPDWFGVEASLLEYIEQVKAMPFFAAFAQGAPVGFLALKAHNPQTAEICVMGILPTHHRQGIGRRLLEYAEDACRKNSIEFLTVKTLDASREDTGYANTRQFYKAMGFVPLEVFALYWDADNPCLFLAKHLYCLRRNHSNFHAN